MSDERPERQDEDRGGEAQRDPETDRVRGEAGSAPAAQPREGASDTTA